MKTNNEQARELLEQGKVLYSLDKYREAISYFQKAMEADRYCEEVYENLSMCYIMLDEYDKARQVLSQYLLLNKKSGAAYFHLGNIALLEGRADEAKACYSKAEILGFTNPAMFVNLASFYEDANDVDRALEQYNKILRGNPYDYQVLERKAQLLFRQRRFGESLQVARTMVQTDIDAFPGHQLLYVSLIMLDRYEEAGKYLDELMQRFPGNEMVLFDRARLYDLTGQVDQALALLEGSFDRIEDDPRLATLKLGLLLQQKKAEEAMELIQASPALQRDSKALTMLYSMYFAKEDYAAAMDCCQKIRALGEEDSQYYATWYFMPLAQKRLGKEEQAEKDFTEAVKVLREAARKNPGQIDIDMYRALCEYQLGHYREAAKLADFLLAVRKDVAAFHLVAAAAYGALGDGSRARAEKEAAARLDSGGAGLPL